MKNLLTPVISGFIILGVVLFFGMHSMAEKTQNIKILYIQQIETESGIKAWFVRAPDLPIISLDFGFQGAGATNDPDNLQGVAQLLSNTLDEGAGQYGSTAFQKTLSDNSITLNFRQSRDHFSGHVKTLSRHKDLAFELLHLSLSEPRFEDEAVERMKQANISRIRSALANPNWNAARIYNDQIYGDHLYARNSGGTLSSLPKITKSDLQNHINTTFSLDRLRVGIVGNISEAEARALLEKAFSQLPKTKDMKTVLPHKLDKKTGEIIVYEKDIPQTYIRLAWDGIEKDHADYYSALVMNYIFGGGGFGSRLMSEVREKQGLSYGIYSSLDHLDHSNQLTIATSTQNDTTTKVLEIVHDEIDRIVKDGVSAEELQRAKNYLTGSLPLSLTSTDRISGLLLSLQLDNLPITYLDERYGKIQSVTQDDVKRLAKTLLSQKNFKTILVGQPKGVVATTQLETLPNVE